MKINTGCYESIIDVVCTLRYTKANIAELVTFRLIFRTCGMVVLALRGDPLKNGT